VSSDDKNRGEERSLEGQRTEEVERILQQIKPC
jgi:hypothetical protein